MATKRKTAKETFSRYDTADYLKSEDDIAAYLDAVMEDAADDPALISAALGNVARAYGMIKLANDTGLTREGLYKALGAGGNPTLATVVKVMKALGMRLSVSKAA
ncbi:addiction module antitoxin [Steroidobacter denitrificans]|uniref:Addiction module antitoxin n=1 Tax=Steroidobacter denitrificans TaxID=465721 RepID=A0A127FBD2_STEDE|nr:addiction module antidote protein [Steroidobacter denitrificans]AMN46905.1 addiction module antitoxin [Steroidobacter denitrificans]